MTEEIVQNTIRDKTFAKLRSNPENNFCIDCEKKNPRWASVYLGVHLCIDCAGKHRQFGVMYSFVKSTNLDSWNQRQIKFMEQGGNTRALQYFKKCGIITATNKHIDYKSQIVQKYKGVLTDEVDNSFRPMKVEEKKVQPIVQKKTQQSKQNNDVIEKKNSQIQSNIQNKAEEIQQEVFFNKKNKKEKKKINAQKINIDFQSYEFDDGVSKAQKQKLMKINQNAISDSQVPTQVNSHSNENKAILIEAPKIEAPKQMQITAAKETLEKFKQKDNIKALSSENFKQTSVNSAVLQQNLNKFSGAQSISSAAFFGEQQVKEERLGNFGITLEKVKNAISNAGEKLYSKLSSYLSKS